MLNNKSLRSRHDTLPSLAAAPFRCCWCRCCHVRSLLIPRNRSIIKPWCCFCPPSAATSPSPLPSPSPSLSVSSGSFFVQSIARLHYVSIFSSFSHHSQPLCAHFGTTGARAAASADDNAECWTPNGAERSIPFRLGCNLFMSLLCSWIFCMLLLPDAAAAAAAAFATAGWCHLHGLWSPRRT